MLQTDHVGTDDYRNFADGLKFAKFKSNKSYKIYKSLEITDYSQ